MDDLTKSAIDLMLGSALTNHPVDNKRAALALKAAYEIPDREAFHEVMKIIVRKRAIHREWITLSQRNWQAHQRSVTPLSCINRYNRWGKKHDLGALIRADEELVATRERYVRCDGKDHSCRSLKLTWR